MEIEARTSLSFEVWIGKIVGAMGADVNEINFSSPRRVIYLKDTPQLPSCVEYDIWHS